MTTQKQTNNNVVKIYKDKRNSSSFLLNNEMFSQSWMLFLSELKKLHGNDFVFNIEFDVLLNLFVL